MAKNYKPISFTDFNKNLLDLLHQATSSLEKDFLHGSPKNFEFHCLGLLRGMHPYFHNNPLLQTMSLTELQLQSRSIHLLIRPRDFPLHKRCATCALRSGSGAKCLVFSPFVPSKQEKNIRISFTQLVF